MFKTLYNILKIIMIILSVFRKLQIHSGWNEPTFTAFLKKQPDSLHRNIFWITVSAKLVSFYKIQIFQLPKLPDL